MTAPPTKTIEVFDPSPMIGLAMNFQIQSVTRILKVLIIAITVNVTNCPPKEAEALSEDNQLFRRSNLNAQIEHLTASSKCWDGKPVAIVVVVILDFSGNGVHLCVWVRGSIFKY
mmetsp:Transcript_4556/g.13773  ORF Transcript_4556/g.13773 Transcript_4556/m.13773 type:complete len:115 (-) Transcript_4556:1033-1377(-)